MQQPHRPVRLNILALPLLGRFLRWRWGRASLQLTFLLIAALLIIDGFTGPQVAPRNLATVLPWVHYRGIIILVLLLAGNFFCMVCPFHVPRSLAKRLSSRGPRFPRYFRNKWVSIASLFTIFFLYEWLDLWASPFLTAWVIVAYILAAFVLDAFFQESPFCKYVCPLGAFNFAYSTLAPTQIQVTNPQICAHCQGKECVNGSWSAEAVVRVDTIPVQTADGATVYEKRQVEHGKQGVLGCPTLLFPPQIQSNMDCILCLDCVRACPHQNIALAVRQPMRELLQPDVWPKRWDFSLFIIILAFMGVMNAFGMVPPVYVLQEQLAQFLNIRSEFIILLLVFLVGNIVLPVALILLTAYVTRALTRTQLPLRHIVAAFAPSFVPLGFGIWFAHYVFHFLITPLSIIPVVQEFLGQKGEWARFSASVNADVISFMQALALLGGFAMSLFIAQKVALRLFKRDGLLGFMPWAFVLLLLMAVAFAIFTLPMEMRGSALMG